MNKYYKKYLKSIWRMLFPIAENTKDIKLHIQRINSEDSKD